MTTWPGFRRVSPSSIEHVLRHAGRRRCYDEPAHLHVALARAEDRLRRAEILRGARIERAGRGVFPDLEQPAEIRVAEHRRRAAIEDDDRFAAGVVAGDDAAHGFVEGHGHLWFGVSK
jgi:hypothetical protein